MAAAGSDLSGGPIHISGNARAAPRQQGAAGAGAYRRAPTALCARFLGAGAPCAVRISPATQSVRDGDDDDDAGPRFVIALKDEWGNDVPREGVEMSYQVDGKPAAAAKAGEKRGADGKAKGDSSSKSELLGKQLAEGDACGDTPDGALKVKLPAKMFPRGEHEVQFYVRGVKGVAGCVGCSSDTVRVMTILCVRLHVCMCV